MTEPDMPEPARTGQAATRTGSRAFRLVGVVLLVLLGFALAVSVRSNRGTAGLVSARQEDLVRILDDLDSRAGRLRDQVGELQQSRERLAGAQGDQAALEESRQRAQQLGILAGTVAAEGPGVVLTIDDTDREVRADVLVDTVQELRDAGAEVLDLNGVRLGVDSYLVDSGSSGSATGPTADRAVTSGISVDGKPLSPPYRFTALGDAETMAQALQIPGGIVDSVAARPGAKATLRSASHLEVRSLRPLPTRKYARPAPS